MRRERITVTDAEAAWAAGLFEGEGTWSGQRSSVCAALSMTDPDVVERFHSVVGVGRLGWKPVRNGWKPQLQWRVTDRAGVERVLALFRPWLGERRLARGEEVLRLQAERTRELAVERARVCKNGHPRTDENTEIVHRPDRARPYRRCRICLRAANRRQRLKNQRGGQ